MRWAVLAIILLVGVSCVSAVQYTVKITGGKIYYRNSSLLPNNPYVTVQEFSTSNPLVLSVSDTNPVDSRKIHVLTVNGVECYVNITLTYLTNNPNGYILELKLEGINPITTSPIEAPYAESLTAYIYNGTVYNGTFSGVTITPWGNASVYWPQPIPPLNPTTKAPIPPIAIALTLMAIPIIALRKLKIAK